LHLDNKKEKENKKKQKIPKQINFLTKTTSITNIATMDIHIRYSQSVKKSRGKTQKEEKKLQSTQKR
jgi:hypothetical protein